MKRVVGKRLQQIIEKRLAEAGDEEEGQVTQLEPLESEEGTATAEEADEQHQQDRRHKTQDDERERRQDSQRMLDSDAADRPDDHRDDECADRQKCGPIPAKRHRAQIVFSNCLVVSWSTASSLKQGTTMLSFILAEVFGCEDISYE